MKITNVEIDIIERDTGDLEVKDERFNIGGKTKQGVLRIKTSEGFEGNSFIGDQAANSLDRIQIINEKIKPLIIGMDSDNREWLWSQVENIAGHGLPIHASWAPIDVALWDLAGKILNKPVYRLLGGRNTQISLYATYPPRHNNSLGFIEEAKELLSEGYLAYKIHPGNLSVKETIKTIDGVRNAVGEKMTLMLDRNHGYSLNEALRIGHSLDENLFYCYC